MTGTALRLKQPTGWFAAGREVAQALSLLSDATFKLFMWICLNADRGRGAMRIEIQHVARGLGKTEAQIEDSLRELLLRDVCQPTAAGAIQVTDRFWPYERGRLPTKDDCRAVTGKIKNFKPEADGDYHIRFIPDDGTAVNDKNTSEQGGALVAEPICQNAPSQADAKEPCKGYSGPKFQMAQFCPSAPNTPPAPAAGKEDRTYACRNAPRTRIDEDLIRQYACYCDLRGE
jgi:hypothetical protein